MIFVGDDWAEDHHDVHVRNEAGERLAARRLPEGLEGIRRLHELVAGFADDAAEVVVGIETDRGLWVHALAAAGYAVYAINPLAVARYRERHNVGGAKSDAGDAKVLADLVRTDRHNHRPIAGDTSDAEAIKVLARAHQNTIWARTRHTNQLRNALREYFPAALEAFDDLADRDTLAVLAKAPTPDAAARLTLGQIVAALKRSGRKRNLEGRATEIQTALRADQLAAPAAVTNAFAATTRAAVGIIGEMNRQIADLEAALATDFEQHPDADIYLSLPGLGDVLGARVLGEFGDDPNRDASAKSRKNYAGTSPLTVASGKKRPSSRATCATSGSTTRSTNGPSAHSRRVRAVAPSTTSAAPRATSTTKPYARSATDSSESSTAASPRAPPTTKTRPGPTAERTATTSPLDFLRPWVV